MVVSTKTTNLKTQRTIHIIVIRHAAPDELRTVSKTLTHNEYFESLVWSNIFNMIGTNSPLYSYIFALGVSKKA